MGKIVGKSKKKTTAWEDLGDQIELYVQILSRDINFQQI